MGDNLVPYVALFGGKINVAKISNHTLTNIYVVKQFLGDVIEVDKEKRIISSK
jgi:RNA 3'-terminal phosphate cyclase (ATP)